MLISPCITFYIFSICHFSILSSSHDYQDLNKVYYLDWISLYDDQSSNTYDNDVLLDIVSSTDDVPLQSVDIPFLFPYFGQFQKVLFVNPNGALHLDAASITPCGIQFVSSPVCNIENNYYGVIAGFFTDLYPKGSNSSKILKSISNDNNSIKITYLDIPLFVYKNIMVTFQIELKSDGNIKIHYLNYISSDLFQQNNNYSGYYNHYMIGVRPSRSNINYFVQQDYQKSAQKLWNTTLLGVYPVKSLLATNTSLNLCPISPYWCITPSTIPESQTTRINISTISISCIHQFIYKCVFTTFTANQVQLRSLSVEAIPIDNKTFSCIIPSSIFSSNIVTISVSLLGYFNDNNNKHKKNYINGILTDHTMIMRTPLNLTVIPPNVNSTENCITSWTNRTETCDTCSICSRNFSCLTQSRSCGALIYDTPSPCTGICTSNSTGGINSYIIQDKEQKCCHLTDLDCMGNCHGTATIKGHYTCECKDDCLGICGGTSTCPPTAMPTSPPKLLLSAPIIFANISYIKDMPLDSMGIFSKIYQLQNPNPFNVTITGLNITGSLRYDPIVNVTLLVPQLLEPFHFTDISINVSFLRILRGHINLGWELKYLDLYYTKVIANSSSSSGVNNEPWLLRIPIEVEVQGCSNITSKSICSNSPGCLYCVTYPDQRLLRADDTDNDSNVLSTNDPSSSSRRSRSNTGGIIKYGSGDNNAEDISLPDTNSIEDFNLQTNRLLYNNIVPSSIGDVVSSVEGYCIAGKTTTASCDITIVEYGTDSSFVWLVGVVIASSVSVILCLFSY